ncbi:hypothetical protein NP493_606g03051 [Ridgeia piscesae]|uniref:Uncharacterized protein n=1 Tax=Ridgeia piscesae TaxID=27915 RepID=A0AAD9KU13_RIDPI|nr:hypothetical protein NP493_606g03051 [Ridgeia piscesae]
MMTDRANSQVDLGSLFRYLLWCNHCSHIYRHAFKRLAIKRDSALS